MYDAAKILPVVKNQHLLLVTLLICNAAAMEVMLKTSPSPLCYQSYVLGTLFNVSHDFYLFQTLPIFLDSLTTAWGAILISVTLILLFGEVRLASPVIFD